MAFSGYQGGSSGKTGPPWKRRVHASMAKGGEESLIQGSQNRTESRSYREVDLFLRFLTPKLFICLVDSYKCMYTYFIFVYVCSCCHPFFWTCLNGHSSSADPCRHMRLLAVATWQIQHLLDAFLDDAIHDTIWKANMDMEKPSFMII